MKNDTMFNWSYKSIICERISGFLSFTKSMSKIIGVNINKNLNCKYIQKLADYARFTKVLWMLPRNTSETVTSKTEKK